MQMTYTISDIKGYYYPDEIALLLGVKRAKVYRWLKHYWQERMREDNTTDFYSMIEMYVFMQLRDRGYSIKKIRQVHAWLKVFLKTDYPFATKKFYTTGGDLLFEYQGFVSANQYGQRKISEFVRPFADKIEFSGSLADKFYPLGKTGWIESDPEIMGGVPVIRGTRIDTWSIVSMLKAGDSTQLISWAYNIPEAAIEAVKEFHNLEL